MTARLAYFLAGCLAGALSAYLLLVYIALNSGGTVPEPGGDSGPFV